MRFGSVCSGIEAASVAWHPLGWQAAWLAEIEAFPSAVLAHHYPTVPNLGDMTTITRRILSGEVEAPDVFTGGTPCQAFSVAGLRRSLDDARGNLSLTFCEIADAIDHVRVARGDQPSIIVYENVPGILSTKDNAFGCFLAGLAGEDGELQPPGGRWANAGLVHGPTRSVAWRTLDAQYFGVAQRRRRVWVVASARDGFDPAEVLFEWDRVRRDSAPSREAREIAPTIPSRSTAGGGLGTDFDCDGGVITMAHGQGGAEIGFDRCPTLTCNHEAPIAAQPVGVTVHGTDPTVQKVASYDDVAQCLRARTPGNIDNSSTTVVQQPVAFDTYNQAVTGNVAQTLCSRGDSPGGNAHLVPAIAFHPTQDPISSTDGTTHAMGTGSKGGCATVAVAVGVDCYNGALTGEVAATMGTSGSPVNSAGPQVMQAVAATGDVFHTLRAEGFDASEDGTGRGAGAVAVSSGHGWWSESDGTAQTLRAQDSITKADTLHISGMAVRRLTPRECERLQGFPDDWTLIPWRGKPADQCPDGPRYKALGNSWAVPCARWIGARIVEVLT